MKIYLIIYFGFLSFANASSIGDLQFLPSKGTFATTFDTKYGTGKNEVDVHSPTGKINDYYTVRKKQIHSSVGLGYSFTDRLYANATISYYFSDKNTTTYNIGSTIEGTSFKRKSLGITNPNLSLKYRFKAAIDPSDIIIDGTVSSSPNIGKKRYASTSKQGNEKRGGATYSLLLDFGKSIEDFTFIIFLHRKYFLEANGIDLYDDSKVTNASTKSSAMGTKISFPSFGNFKAQLSLEIGKTDPYSIENLGNSIQIGLKRYNNFQTGIDWEIKSDILLLRSYLEVYSANYTTTAQGLVMENDEEILTLGSGLIYQF